jgi:hypothetical protein
MVNARLMRIFQKHCFFGRPAGESKIMTARRRSAVLKDMASEKT